MKDLAQGTISSPLGFKTNALHCGLKDSRNLDLGLIYSIVKANAAGVFTKNKIQGAHIGLDKLHLRDCFAQAIIVNSGNANCCTGKKGQQDIGAITLELARELDLKKSFVLAASTGIVGEFLPCKKILDKIPELAQGIDFSSAQQFAQSILTTDTCAKQSAVEFKIKGKRIVIGAAAKGAGMICPNMATMLCFITTDAYIEPAALKKALSLAVEKSFNCISVDGQMSPNDSVFILSNGLADNELICQQDSEFEIFTKALTYICLKLAKMIILDAEGATKIIQVKVKGAKTKKQARSVNSKIINSPLVKTMAAGENSNWGRIVVCVGTADAFFKPENIEIFLQGKCVYKNLCPALKVEAKHWFKLLRQKEWQIEVNLNAGNYEHTTWTSDLTPEYVKINMGYS
ncbi:MAG: hypothetical protein DRP78_01960 [Candidatus Omnitrophota bacterium]|nr:MAG: hypothetical protein DRP78_01960 [Candidatus Omnitrophota bacterium]